MKREKIADEEKIIQKLFLKVRHQFSVPNDVIEYQRMHTPAENNPSTLKAFKLQSGWRSPVTTVGWILVEEAALLQPEGKFEPSL